MQIFFVLYRIFSVNSIDRILKFLSGFYPILTKPSLTPIRHFFPKMPSLFSAIMPASDRTIHTHKEAIIMDEEKILFTTGLGRLAIGVTILIIGRILL